MPEKVTVYVLRLEDDGFDGNFLALSEDQLPGIADGLYGSEPGARYSITVEEWDRAEFDALTEWEGW